MYQGSSFSYERKYEMIDKERCRTVQRDPYGYLQTNWEVQKAKMLPLRMFVNAFAMGFAAVYYLGRHNEMNRVMHLKFSLDMMANVGARVLLAGVASDLATRKAFVNYSLIQQHKVANNEVRKIMTQFPNAKTLLKPH